MENLVYPNLKAIASKINIKLRGLKCDGPIPSSFEAHCQTGNISALYINPTIKNPTTLTIPLRRREALANVALQYNIPIIEDDA